MNEITSATRLGSIVRTRRLELGMTQDSLASRACVSAKTVVTLEMGRAGGIRLDKLRAILDTLGMSVYVGHTEQRETMSYQQLYESLTAEGNQ